MGTGGLLLAVEADGAGAHPAAGRHSGVSGALLDPRLSKETVAVAEGAGFAFAVFGDGPVAPAAGARIEAGVRAAYLSQLTRRIGLAPMLHVTTAEPWRPSARPRSTTSLEAGR
jgi:hypothetical protein